MIRPVGALPHTPPGTCVSPNPRFFCLQLLNDTEAIENELESFCEKYALAEVEHCFIISPQGVLCEFKGNAYAVNPAIAGEDYLKGSIGIHNHPIESGKTMSDSFSEYDLKFDVEYQQGRQYLISGERRNVFEFTKQYTGDEILRAWENASYEMLEQHMKSGTQVVWRHEEILCILSETLEGFEFYENF